LLWGYVDSDRRDNNASLTNALKVASSYMKLCCRFLYRIVERIVKRGKENFSGQVSFILLWQSSGCDSSQQRLLQRFILEVCSESVHQLKHVSTGFWRFRSDDFELKDKKLPRFRSIKKVRRYRITDIVRWKLSSNAWRISWSIKWLFNRFWSFTQWKR